MQFLRGFDLESRVSVVLNRCQKKALFTKEQVEELLKVPVIKTFPNDYPGVNRAMTEGRVVDINSDLGKSFTEFANEMIDRRVVGQAPEKKKFMELFSVPARTAVNQK
jgi:Flp pilus assembly CpaE family ATPase